MYGYRNVNLMYDRERYCHFFDMVYRYWDWYFFDMVHRNRNGNGDFFDMMYRHMYLFRVMMMDRMYVIGHVDHMMFTETK